MSATIHPMPRRVPETDESWLSVNRLRAYYILAAVNPELFASGSAFAVVRATEINRIEAALILADAWAEGDTDRRATVIAIMREDALAEQQRTKKGGW